MVEINQQQQQRLNKEISLIVNANIKSLVNKCLSKAPRYFWTCPSSSTGKYHPADENGVGGLILHTKRVVKVAEDLCRNYDIDGDDRDCVIAAAIMHDMCKLGYPEEQKYTVSGHGALWIQVVQQVVSRSMMISSPIVRTIGRLIGCHMGRFDMPYVVSDDRLSTILQIADYVASREYIKVEVN